MLLYWASNLTIYKITNSIVYSHYIDYDRSTEINWYAKITNAVFSGYSSFCAVNDLNLTHGRRIVCLFIRLYIVLLSYVDFTIILVTAAYSHEAFKDLLFVCFGVFIPLENFSFIWRRHQYQWRAANNNLRSALMTIKQWGLFGVPHLLRHPF